MQSLNRISLVLLSCLFAASPSWAAPFDEFSTVDGQGVDPLVDPYPFFIFPGKTKTAGIIFQSDDYAGVVTLSVGCCEDLAGNSVAIPTGVSLDPVPYPGGQPLLLIRTIRERLGPGSPTLTTPPELKSNQFVAVAHGVHPVGLKVTTALPAQAGLFVATVTAAKSDGSSNSTKVKVNVLPAPTETGVTPRCAAFDTTRIGGDDVPTGAAAAGTSVISTTTFGGSNTIIPGLFDQKEKNPSKTQWDIGYDPGDGGVVISLSKSGGALPAPQANQANFFFHNAGSRDRQFVLFDTATCAPTGPVTLKQNEYGSVLLASRPPTRTLLLRMHGDNGGSTWVALSVLDAAQFWTVFGGKEVNFNWFE
jgi:hypothetical protein